MPKNEFISFLLDMLEPLGELSSKRLFGGYALCKNDCAFALVFQDTVYFKVDDSNRADYEALGSEPFSYEKQGKTILVSNWQVPAEILDDQDALIEWADKACAVAFRAKK